VNRRRPRPGPRVLVTLSLVLLAAACADEGATGGAQPQGSSLQVTLGTKDFPEQFVLGELYKQALAVKGYKVTLEKNIGSTEVIDKALTSREIDAYPEYLGVALSVAGRRETATGSAQETYDLARRFYEGRGQAISEPTPFSNVDAVATTKFFAQEHGLRTLRDLRKLKRFTLGARPEFETRFQGLEGLQQVYGLTNAEFKSITIGAQYAALDAGDVQAANVFSTDGQLAGGDYAILEDPEHLFGYQHVALVIHKDKLDALGGAEFMAVVNAVNRRLTANAIIALNQSVVVDEQDEAAVAARFLRENGLLGRE
jgi:osmoprotectant transport system substrate-binding protein